jgi:hypothetical protein
MDDIEEALKFLDEQTAPKPSLNEQVGFDFQGLPRSYREDRRHPDSRSIAQFGRIWVYDAALSIYANLKTGRMRQAAYQTKRLMQLASKEREKGFLGLWHFSYNTQGDAFVDPRGPTGANAWCLNALYAYALACGDASVAAWANRAVEEYLFPLQVTDPSDPRYGLIRAGLYNAEDVARKEAMGYRVYEGNPNHRYEHVILEHCADVAGTFRLAHRANRRLRLRPQRFCETLAHRHDILMQGIRRRFWQNDHFVSALDSKGEWYRGTDGQPSVAVDNNTWAAHIWLPYDPDLVRAAILYVEGRFLIQAPPALLEDAVVSFPQGGLEGLYYFPSSFQDPFVEVLAEDRPKMERLLQPEAAYGFMLLLADMALVSSDSKEEDRWGERAIHLYRQTSTLIRHYPGLGGPYASANVPNVFSTLQSVTTAAFRAIVAAILFHGASIHDVIGVTPPAEFSVAGQAPRFFPAER